MNTMRKCSTCGATYAGDICPACMAGFARKPTGPTEPPEEPPLSPGQSFHGLEVVELLGRGGMGVVYKARQPALDRFVALKILPRKMAQDPDFQGRFAREAKALGSLSHPSIVAVHDFGAEAGLFFFVMEFVDGVNLRQVLRQKRLAPEEALRIVPQLCDALEYAHGEGVVHRDIKPENILLDRKGRVKIADFGLAKLVGLDTGLSALTQTHMVMGTPHYMAPEQVENPRQVDHRADIYSMGVVFYEMLTGELPIGRFEPPSKKAQIDVRLDEVVLRTLEKEPARRYQHAGDVKNDVTRVTTATSYAPTLVTPPPARRRRWPPALGIAAVAVLAAVSVAILAPRGGPDPAPAAPPDLSKVYFGPHERPGGYVYAQTDAVLTRNPFPAKDKDEIEALVKILDGVGLQNLSHTDIVQGYLAVWFRGACGFAALETPIAERLMRDFAVMPAYANRWSHRNGPLVVLAWSGRRDDRLPFADLVGRLQRKLGLPEEAPALALENLRLEKGDLPSGWSFAEPPPPPRLEGVKRSYAVSLRQGEEPPTIHLAAYDFGSADAAGRAPSRPAGASARKTEVLRAGGVLVTLTLTGEGVGACEKLAQDVRTWMGYPSKSFETIVPAKEELPAGYAFEKVEEDAKAILADLAAPGVQAARVTRAWRARLRPAGSIVLFETDDTGVRSALEEALRKSGPAWDSDRWVFGVEAPDAAGLDALENRMREKFGWDPNPPRKR